MTENIFDVVVIGGGPGGYVAAIRASQLGMRTAVVEREHLGGICLNWGCIPTKALLRTSEINHILQNLDAYGFSAKNISFDLSKIVKRSRDVAGRLRNGVGGLLKKNKVTVFEGAGTIAGPGRVAVTGNDGKTSEIAATNIILATGARPRTLPGLEPDGKRVWTYREAMTPDKLPGRLLVVGSGAIGIEFASFYSDLGAEVTVLEVLDRILPVEDAEISAFARKALESQGMAIHTGARVAALERNATSVNVSFDLGGSPTEITVDRVILAIGVQGNIEDVGIEGTGIATDRSFIVTNEWLQTGESGIFAIGDVAGPPCLAHKASHEGVICVEHIAGIETHPLDPTRIPGCTYCRPQVASVGLTEEAATAAGRDVRIGRFPYAGNGKAIAMGETEGLIKTVFDARTGELLGAHMVGAEVTEMIQGYGIARTLETTEAELMETVFPHPTLSEMMHESVLDAFGRVIHF